MSGIFFYLPVTGYDISTVFMHNNNGGKSVLYGMKTALDDFIMQRRGIYGVLHVAILILSVILVIAISIDTFKSDTDVVSETYLNIQLWICLFFLADFFIEWVLAARKCVYLASHAVFFIISIPYLNIFRYADIVFPPETEYLLRFIPLIRGGYALVIVVGQLFYNRASSLLVTYMTLLGAAVYFSSLLFYVLEHDLNPMVKGYGDALWWALMDVTTVGSNIYAVTVAGKGMSVALAAVGMMMFPVFTVYITSLVQRGNGNGKPQQ